MDAAPLSTTVDHARGQCYKAREEELAIAERTLDGVEDLGELEAVERRRGRGARAHGQSAGDRGAGLHRALPRSDGRSRPVRARGRGTPAGRQERTGVRPNVERGEFGTTLHAGSHQYQSWLQGGLLSQDPAFEQIIQHP